MKYQYNTFKKSPTTSNYILLYPAILFYLVIWQSFLIFLSTSSGREDIMPMLAEQMPTYLESRNGV